MNARTGFKHRASALLPRMAVVISAVILSACGNYTLPTRTTVTPSPTPTPPGPPSVIAQGSGGLGVFYLAEIPLATTTTGRLDVTVDWTFTTNDVDIYLTRGGCSFEQFLAADCSFVTYSESPSAKPERISAPGSPPDRYTLWIGNLGPSTESVSYQVVLSPSASSTASAVMGSRAVAAQTRRYVASMPRERP